MIILDLVKIVLRIRAITLLLESSYIKINYYSEIVFRQVLYFVFEEIIIDIRITIDLLQKVF
jgi:hypothetical protein